MARTRAALPALSETLHGTRDGSVVRVTGTTTGLGMDSLVTPAARTLPTRAYRAGTSVAVSTSGTFTRTRKVHPKKPL